jgi:hypothetical protein
MGHDCLTDTAIGLAPTCLLECSSNADCPGGMECVGANNDAEFVCFPTTWIAGNPPPTLEVTGSQCTAEAQCASDLCLSVTGAPGVTGWCSASCTTSSQCGGDGINWCVATQSGNYCYPDCSHGCGDYTSAVCSSVTTTDGFIESVCN